MNGKNTDLFKDTNLEGNLHKITLNSKKIKNDIGRNLLIKHHGNLNICIRFKAIKKLEYIICLIKRIELAKQIFVCDIEKGIEVFIPPDLRIN